jgi:hypothetical protein
MFYHYFRFLWMIGKMWRGAARDAYASPMSSFTGRVYVDAIADAYALDADALYHMVAYGQVLPKVA